MSLGETTNYHYDQVGNLTKVVGPEGEPYHTEYFHDKLNRQIETIVAKGTVDQASTKTEYHALGMVSAVVDALGRRAELGYDNLRFLASLTEAKDTEDEATTRYVNDYVGNLKFAFDPRGDFYFTEYLYDDANRLVEMRYATGTEEEPGPVAKVKFEYDGNDNLIRRTDPRGEDVDVQFTYDALNRLWTSRDTEGRVTTLTYYKNGWLYQEEDNKGYTGTYTYYKNGWLKTYTDPMDGVESYEYYPTGAVRTVTAPMGGVTTYFYDALDREIERIDAVGKHWFTEYNDDGTVDFITDPRGFKESYEYDFQKRVKALHRDQGETPGESIATWRFRYDAVGNLLETLDPRGGHYWTRYDYDNLNRLKKVETNIALQDGSSTGVQTYEYEYDDAGNRTLERDSRGVERVNFYDAQNRIVRIVRDIEELGSGETAEWKYAYDLAGNLIRSTDPRGDYYTTEYDYYHDNQIKEIRTPQGHDDEPVDPAVERFEYDDNGNLEFYYGPREVDGELLKTEYKYDRLDRLEFEWDPQGNMSQYKYDPNGNLERETHHSIHGSPVKVIQRKYDDLNRLSWMLDSMGFLTTFEYDDSGNLRHVIGPFADSEGALYEVTQRHDGAGRMIERTDEEKYITKTRYDAVGNVIRRTDGRGDFYAVLIAYNALNDIVSITTPTGTEDDPGTPVIERRVYDSAGLLIEIIDPRGDAFKTIYDHDAQGRLLSISRMGGTPSAPQRVFERWEYDVVGNIVRHTDPRGEFYEEIYKVDAQGRRLEITRQTGTPGSSKLLTEKLTYDAAGNVILHIGMGGADYRTEFEYDELNNLKKTTNPAGQVTNYLYDRYGNLREQSDLHGEATYTYDARDRITGFTPSTGGNVTYEYDGNRNIVTSTSPGGRVTVLVYDGLNRLVEETTAEGTIHEGIRSSEYDAVGNRTRTVDRRGTVSEFVYDARGLLLKETLAVLTDDEATASYRYNEMGWLIETTPHRGADYLIEYTHDNLGHLASRTVHLGPEGGGGTVTEIFRHDAVGNLTYAEDGRGADFAITHTYDALNRLVNARRNVGTATSPNMATEIHVYDDAGNLHLFTDAAGHTITYTYDLIGRMKTASREDGLAAAESPPIKEEWTYTENPDGLVIRHSDALGLLEVTEHDIAGRVSRVTHRESGVTIYTYDLEGNVETMTNGPVQRTYDYDILNRRETVKDESGRVITTYHYDEEGNVTQLDDGNNLSVFFNYNRHNQQDLRMDAAGRTEERDYDDAGNLVSITDGAGNSTFFTYDGRGRVASDTDAFGTRFYSYDGAGNMIESIDRNGRERRYAYNGLNLLVSEQWIVAGEVATTLTFAYDKLGRLTSASGGGGGTVTYTYAPDATGRMTSSSATHVPGQPKLVLEYDVDSIGKTRAETLRYENGATIYRNAYAYESLTNRLASITQTGSLITDKRVGFSYESDILRVSGINRLDLESPGAVAVNTVISYTGINNLFLLRHATGAGAVLHQYGYTHDGNNRIETITSSRDGKATYIYDTSHQLIAVQYDNPAIPDESYGFDGAGAPLGAGIVMGLQNRLQDDGVFTYEYDDEGNVILKTHTATGIAQVFTWDHRNRLTGIQTYNGVGTLLQSVTYLYDALNRRVMTEVSPTPGGTSGTQRRYFVYSGDNIVAEYVTPGAGAATLDKVYLQGPRVDEIYAQDNLGGSVYWLLTDHLGGVRDVVNSSGVLLDHIVLSGFGEILSRTNANVDIRHFFQGREFDAESGLYYYRARYYDPGAHRFLSPDPLGFSGQDSNLYRFVFNDPVNQTDPSGKILPIFAIALVAIAGITTGVSFAAPELFVNDTIVNAFEGIDSAGDENTKSTGLLQGIGRAIARTIIVPGMEAMTNGWLALNDFFGGDGAFGTNVYNFQSRSFMGGVNQMVQGAMNAAPPGQEWKVALALGLAAPVVAVVGVYAGMALAPVFTMADIGNFAIGMWYGDYDLAGEAAFGLIGESIAMVSGGFKLTQKALKWGGGAARNLSKSLVQSERFRGLATDVALFGKISDGVRKGAAMMSDGTIGRKVASALDEGVNKLLSRFRGNAKLSDASAADLPLEVTTKADNAVAAGKAASRSAPPVKGEAPPAVRPDASVVAHTPGTSAARTVAQAGSGQDDSLDILTQGVKAIEVGGKAMAQGEKVAEASGSTNFFNFIRKLGVPVREVTEVMSYLRNAKQRFEMKAGLVLAQGSKGLREARNIIKSDLTPQVLAQVRKLESIRDGGGHADDMRQQARMFLELLFTGNPGDRYRSVEMLYLLSKQEHQDVTLLLRKFVDNHSLYTADSDNLKVVQLATKIFGDILLVGSKGMTLKQLHTFDNLVKQAGHIKDAAVRGNWLKKIYNERMFKDVGADAEGFVIKVEKALKGGGFDPKNSDIDFVPLALERMVEHLDLLGGPGTGRSYLYEGSYIHDDHWKAIARYSKGIGEKPVLYDSVKTRDFSHQLGPATLAEVSRLRAMVDKQLFAVGYVGKSLGIEMDAYLWLMRERSHMTRLGGQIFSLSEAGALVRTQPPAAMTEGAGLARILELKQEAYTKMTRWWVQLQASAWQPTAGTGLSAEEVLRRQLVTATEIAAAWWREFAGFDPGMNLVVAWADLPTGELAQAQVLGFDHLGRPRAGMILVDRDGNGAGWSTGLDLLPGAYDLLTVLAHELGHIYGFTTALAGFAEVIQVNVHGGAVFTLPDGSQAMLTEDREHLDPGVHPGALMNSTLEVGERKLPSALEGAMLRYAWLGKTPVSGTLNLSVGSVTSGGGSVSYLHGDGLPLPGGFVFLAEAVHDALDAGVPAGVQDGGFVQPGATAWIQFGTVSATGGGSVTLSEGGRLFSSLSQVFTLSPGALSLSFTLRDLLLNSNGGGNPPDAFEVALLHAADFTPLTSIDGWQAGDALLNIQSDGVIRSASGVTYEQQGSDLVVTINLAGIPTNVPLALFFNLTGFGAADSTVTIADVRLNQAAEPVNVAPVVQAGPATASLQEGGTLARTGSFSDANGAGLFTATVDYGDGSGQQTLALSGGTFVLSHLFGQNGTYQVLVSITDEGDLVGQAVILVTVSNVAPLVDAGDDRGALVHMPVTVAATVTDPGTQDSHTAEVFWGDGSSSLVPVYPDSRTLTASHVYAVAGEYTVLVRVTDSDGGIGEDTFTVTAVLEAPVVGIVGPAVVSEGAVYTLLLQASGPAASAISGWLVDFGDGSAPVLLPGNATLATHVYADGPNPYTIRATALIGSTEFVAGELSVLVRNVAATFRQLFLTPVINEGQTASLLGGFIKLGTSDTFVLRVAWGDGVIQTFALGAGVRTLDLIHQYLANLPGDAPYLVTVRLTDKDGGVVEALLSIIVRNRPPLVIINPPGTVRAGTAFTITGTVDDTNDDALEIAWNFGDGSGGTYQPLSQKGAVSRSYTYSAPGEYTLTLLARDSEGAVALQEFTFEVLAASVNPDDPGQPVNPGQPGGPGQAGQHGSFSSSAIMSGLLPATAGQQGQLQVASFKLLSVFLSVDEENAAGWSGVPPLVAVIGSAVIPVIGLEAWDSLHALVERLYANLGGTLQVLDFSVLLKAGKLVITLRFSGDVERQLEAGDLEIQVNGAKADPSQVKFHYDKDTQAAVWTLPASEGEVRVILPGGKVQDPSGRLLDGDRDGKEGGDFEAAVEAVKEE